MDRLARRGAVILYATAGIVFLFDRWTKVWAEDSLAPSGPIDVIPGFLRFRFTTNPGGAFSILGTFPWLFAAATITVSILIVAFSLRRRPAMQSVALGLILGGALGNLTDRFVRGPGLSGEVVDFVDVHLGTTFSWPVFNVADSAIVLGAILLVVSSALQAQRSDRGERGDGPDEEQAGDAA